MTYKIAGESGPGAPSGLLPAARDRVCDLDAQGYGPQSIADTLNHEGLPAPAGGRWGKSSVHTVAERHSPSSMVRRAAGLLEAARSNSDRLLARDAAQAAEAVASSLRRTAERVSAKGDELAKATADRLLEAARRAEVAASAIKHDAERAIAQADPPMTRPEAARQASDAAAAARQAADASVGTIDEAGAAAYADEVAAQPEQAERDRAQGGADGEGELPRGVQAARTVHARLSDERYAAERASAEAEQRPLTRRRLADAAAEEQAEAGSGPQRRPARPQAVARARAKQATREVAELTAGPLVDLINGLVEADGPWVRRLAHIPGAEWGDVQHLLACDVEAALDLARAQAIQDSAWSGGDPGDDGHVVAAAAAAEEQAALEAGDGAC